MSDRESKPERATITKDERLASSHAGPGAAAADNVVNADAVVDGPARPIVRSKRNARTRILPAAITLVVTGVAAIFGWAMWNAYMRTPWTRDGTVRVYVVTMAPEVAGRIVDLRVADNQFVRKGDVLLVIDPTDYKDAVQLGEATVRQAQADSENIEAQITMQQAQVDASEAQVESARAALTFAEQQAARYRDLAEKEAGTVQMEQQTASTLRQQQAALKNAQASVTLAQRQFASLRAQLAAAEAGVARAKVQLNQARVNLERTQIHSPVNGWITNLLVQLGDYATVGRSVISVVNAESFWVDAYFEETQIAFIHQGDVAKIKLMAYSQIVRGEVTEVARAINVPNAQPNEQGVASVNPIFTWVRLAQRLPVRIRIDEVPQDVRLVAGMTATVQIDPPLKRQSQ